MTLKLFLSLGKDLITSNNLLNRHRVIQANIASHEPRIQMITEKGNKMVEEGMHDSNDDRKWPVTTLPNLWEEVFPILGLHSFIYIDTSTCIIFLLGEVSLTFPLVKSC